jgi:hypothetical protein
MKRATYNTPHLFGIVDYAGAKRLRPDGDTLHASWCRARLGLGLAFGELGRVLHTEWT